MGRATEPKPNQLPPSQLIRKLGTEGTDLTKRISRGQYTSQLGLYVHLLREGLKPIGH